MISRLATQALPFLGRGWNAIKPRGAMGWTAEVAPNLFFAGLGAAQLPQGTPAELRAGAFVEDLATSLPMGFLGRAAGYGAARQIGRMRGSPLSPEAMGMAQMLTGTGVETIGYGSGLVPRPFATQAWNMADQQVRDEQDRRALAREREIRDQVIAEMTQQAGGLGTLAGMFQPMPGLPAPGAGMFG